MAQSVFVIAEHKGDNLNKCSLEVISAGRKIADDLGQSLSVVLMGNDIEKDSAQLGHYGADTVYILSNPIFENYTTEAFSTAAANIINNSNPDIVLLGATSQGKDLAASLSAKFSAGMAQDCIEVYVEDGSLFAIRPIYSGKVHSKVTFNNSKLKIATIRPNVIPVNAPDTNRKFEIEKVSIDLNESTFKTKVVSVIIEDKDKIDISEANKIVSGGRGLQGPENFKLLEDIADVIGGAVGASRVVVDEDWRPHSDQVGQTGKVVSPGLYIACGISGAVQHMAGVGTAKVVVAINKDPDAPIFQKADFGIIDDCLGILPLLKNELEKLKSSK